MANEEQQNFLPCFSSKYDFEEWLTMARLSGPLAPWSPCQDCNPSFQADMLAEGRCVHAEVRFATTEKKLSDGSIEREEIGIHVMAARRHRNMARP